eukprot:jgi/Chrpa1/25660/Chrysochromulina_OHIO_Genome00022673-RA
MTNTHLSRKIRVLRGTVLMLTTVHTAAPEPGQVWTRDTLKFRMAQFHLNSLYVTGYSDKASGMWVLIPHLDYTAETVIHDSLVDATPASTGPQIIAKQAAELRQMQEQLDQAQAQLRVQESALRAAQELAPAPPAAPRTREPAEHLRPVQPMTPVVSSALAALHAATPVSSLGRVLAPVPEEPFVSTQESKSKSNL